MIVIGLDVHKQSVTAVAIDEAGRWLAEKTIQLVVTSWSAGHPGSPRERLWGVEDCRQLTRWLERQLLAAGEDLVRVPPKLTVPERRAGRTRGKSDPIDALAIARATLREPDLSRPQPGEQRYIEIKLLVDHRDDVVDHRRRTQQRLRWHLFQLDPTHVVPLRMLGRASHLERVSRARPPRPGAAGALGTRARRELPHAQPRRRRARPGTRTAGQRDRTRTARAARLRRRHRSETAGRNRPDQPLQERRPTRPPRRRRATRSQLRPHPTAPAGPPRQPPTQRRALPDAITRPATTPALATTSNARKPKAKAAGKPSAASNDYSSASFSKP